MALKTGVRSLRLVVHRKAVGALPGGHQVVPGGLTNRARCWGSVGEGRSVFAQADVNLFGADVQEAKHRLRLRQRVAISSHGIEQAERTNGIGPDKIFGALD